MREALGIQCCNGHVRDASMLRPYIGVISVSVMSRIVFVVKQLTRKTERKTFVFFSPERALVILTYYSMYMDVMCKRLR